MNLSSILPLIDQKRIPHQKNGIFQDENMSAKLKSAKSIPLLDNIQNPQQLQQFVYFSGKSKGNSINRDAKKRVSLMGLNQKDAFQSLSVKLDAHQSQIEERNLAIDELEQHLIFLKSELSQEKKTIVQKNEANVRLNEEINKLTNKLKSSYSKQEEMQNKLNAAEGGMKILKDQEKVFKEEDIANKSREAALQKRIVEYETKLQQVTTEIKQTKKNEKAEQQSKIEALQKELKNQTEIIEKSKQDEQKIKSLEKDKLDYCSEAQDLRQKCQKLKNQFDQLSQESLKWKEGEQSQTEEINILKRQLTEQLKIQIQFAEEKLLSEKALAEAEKKLTYINDNFKKMDVELERVKRAQCNAEDEVKILKEYIQKKESKISQLGEQLKVLEKQISNNSSETDKKDLEDARNYVNTLKTKENEFKNALEVLSKGENELNLSLKCTYCSKFIKEPITVIPCGHSYCTLCKKGYAKDCIKCGPKVKVEAMYRNELLDDIIEMSKTITNVKESLITLQKQFK